LSSLFIFSPPLYIFNIIFSTWGTSVFPTWVQKSLHALMKIIFHTKPSKILSKIKGSEKKGQGIVSRITRYRIKGIGIELKV
ncbi:MAG: hypothetical protein K6U11_07780, partial [bacterium]|nr:hypothetical protein [bacterium]